MQNRTIKTTLTESTPTEPVTLVEVKSHLRITSTEDDTELTAFITRIRQRIENYCNISMVSKTVVANVDLYKRYLLPYGPVTAVTEVKWRPAISDDYETLTTDDYDFEAEELQSFKCGRHKLTYTTGMTTVPDDLKLAILEEIAYHYENKGEETNKFAGEDIGLSKGAQTLLQPFRVLWI